MREIIIDIQKVKDKKKVDYVVNGSISGCIAESDKKLVILTIPVKIYGFICDLNSYCCQFSVTDGKTEITLPDFECCHLSAIIQ